MERTMVLFRLVVLRRRRVANIIDENTGVIYVIAPVTYGAPGEGLPITAKTRLTHAHADHTPLA